MFTVNRKRRIAGPFHGFPGSHSVHGFVWFGCIPTREGSPLDVWPCMLGLWVPRVGVGWDPICPVGPTLFSQWVLDSVDA